MSELQQTIHAKDPLAEFERQYKGSKEAIPESLTEDSTDGLRKSPDGDDEKGYQTETHRNTGDDNILSSMNYQTEQRPGSLENIDPSVTQDGNAMIRDLEKNWDNKDANNSEIKRHRPKVQADFLAENLVLLPKPAGPDAKIHNFPDSLRKT
jgi:hypothetical protein